MEEILTPELILDALKNNDTCTCSRCQADVKALMLTRLPPKYIVADNTAVPMLLTYYHNKFRVAVLSQSIRACMDVKERPRHIL
jgi:competence protein ComFB